MARSLKMNVDGMTCWDAGTGRSFRMWTLGHDVKLGTSVRLAGEGAKNSPGKCRGEPYTSSADEAFKSSFHALRIPNRTNSTALAQCSSAWHMKTAFSWRCSLLIMPLEAGCPAVVQVKEDPEMVSRVLKRQASNRVPWWVVIGWGQPKWASQMETKALATASAVMSEGMLQTNWCICR